MNLQDFKNIDLKTAGNLPPAVKSALMALMAAVIIFAGYWFLWAPALESLSQARAKEDELRGIFLSKKSQAINLEAYKRQMVDIEKTFGALLKQLPDRSQMDGLLTDINQAGLDRGLEFESFKPGAESVREFYAEMPIAIKVIGGYHQLGAFATDVSRLSRIVTLDDIVIYPLVKDGSPAKDAAAGKNGNDGRLVMEAIAKTYRYLDVSEIQGSKK